MRIVFAGTPEFAAQHLEALLQAGHQVVAVYTQPDRPAGRGQKLMPSPVKQLAVDNAIPVLQPPTLRSPEAQAELAALKPDLMVVVAYGLILPQAVLDVPRLGCINSHASLLPRWRGAAPIQRAIEAGDSESGVTVMQMEAGLDTGPMLLKVSTPIGPSDTGGSLHDRLAALGAQAVVEAVARLQAGALPAFISRSIWSAAEEISSARSSALSVYERRCAPSCWRSSSLMTKIPQTPPTRVVVSSIGRMRRQLIRPSAAVPRSDIPSSA